MKLWNHLLTYRPNQKSTPQHVVYVEPEEYFVKRVEQFKDFLRQRKEESIHSKGLGIMPKIYWLFRMEIFYSNSREHMCKTKVCRSKGMKISVIFHWGDFIQASHKNRFTKWENLRW